MSRVKRSFWKSIFSFFANVSCETLVLEVYIVTFCEFLARNARFGSLYCHFLRMSRVKRSFWKSTFTLFANVSRETLVLEAFILTFCECLVRNARFGSFPSHFLRMSRVKRSFWKSTFTLFANVSCETLVLEVYILTSFWKPIHSNSHFLRMSRGKRSFWAVLFAILRRRLHRVRMALNIQHPSVNS